MLIRVASVAGFIAVCAFCLAVVVSLFKDADPDRELKKFIRDKFNDQ